MKTRTVLIPVLLALLLLPASTLGRFYQTASAQNRAGDMVVRGAERHDTSPSLVELISHQPGADQPIDLSGAEVFAPPPASIQPVEASLDTVVQRSLVGDSLTTLFNQEGVNNVNYVLPPDTQGDIGPNHYVQIVNFSYAIWDRQGNLLLGPANNNTVWSGFGGPCEQTNNGDPIVLYDHQADRWLLSQFSFPNGSSSGPYYQCIAISATGDPTGNWHRYEYLISNTKLNDYPKFGIWPDGYYMTANQFEYSTGWYYAGQYVAVFERDQMLLGNPARMIYGDMWTYAPYLYGMLPSDLDGPEPPTGAPNSYMQVEENPDRLRIWEFHVDWVTPANSTFTAKQTINTAPFDTSLCPSGSRQCIPQPDGAPKVDAISDRLMYRLQYRNFGGYQTLVANHSVDENDSDHAGIRWYELRSSGGDWAIHQQGTFASDSEHRWMGSVAMNRFGDIALGYSVSSETTYPSIRFTGRLGGDPLGVMTKGEGEVVAGNGVQLHSTSRWGDYSMMSVDPVDDCTFWYTQEYYASTSNYSWRTRIASFRLRDCYPNKLYLPLIPRN